MGLYLLCYLPFKLRSKIIGRQIFPADIFIYGYTEIFVLLNGINLIFIQFGPEYMLDILAYGLNGSTLHKSAVGKDVAALFIIKFKDPAKDRPLQQG